jgi:hypothetical protein
MQLVIKNIIIILFLSSCIQSSIPNESENISEIDTLDTVDENPYCDDWTKPSTDQVDYLVTILDTISSIEWNSCYGDWDCGFEGVLVMEGDSVKYRLDAGGWIILMKDGNQIFLGCRSIECWEYFPSEPFCDSIGNSLK